MNKVKEVTDYIAGASNEQKEVLSTLRELIAKAIPEGAENFKWSRPVYATQKDFCYLQYNKKHVNLGFFEFEKIEDPDNLLEGTGEQMRHVKIEDGSELDPPVLYRMIKQASKF
ncbi:MAG: DUF1801 domain-containing protein [Aurantibacter sp.]